MLKRKGWENGKSQKESHRHWQQHRGAWQGRPPEGVGVGWSGVNVARKFVSLLAQFPLLINFQATHTNTPKKTKQALAKKFKLKIF